MNPFIFSIIYRVLMQALMLMILLTVGFSPPPCSSLSLQPSPLNPKTVFPPLLLHSMIYFKESNNYEYCP
nr:MAG TPA: hypothetical protein [Siphoviridae sp. ctX8T1]